MSGYNQLGRQLSTGIGAFFGDAARQKGEMAGLQQVALEDQIEGGRLKLDAARRQAELTSPRSTIARTLMGMGVGAENAPDAEQWVNSGRIDKYEMAPGQSGPVLPAPDFYKPEVRTRIGQALAGSQAVQAGEAKDLKDYYEAQGVAGLNTEIAKALAGGDLVRAAQLRQNDPTKVAQGGLAQLIASGGIGRDVGGGRMAAIEGKPLYNADATGAVLDQYGGALDTANPLATSTIALRGAQTKAQNANAAQSYAAADNSRATADRTRNAPKGTLVQTPDGPVFANPVTGEATPVTVGGQRVKGGSGKGGAGMSATLQKELIEADDNANIAEQTAATLRKALELNDKAYSGVGAKARAVVASNVPGLGSEAADATINLDNMIGEQALSGMKAIFGGNPTEGERAILLDLQASASKTPKQRKAIIERGITLAERRLAINRERAKAIRSGTYLTDGVADPAGDPGAPGGAAPDPVAEALKKYGG